MGSVGCKLRFQTFLQMNEDETSVDVIPLTRLPNPSFIQDNALRGCAGNCAREKLAEKASGECSFSSGAYCRRTWKRKAAIHGQKSQRFGAGCGKGSVCAPVGGQGVESRVVSKKIQEIHPKKSLFSRIGNQTCRSSAFPNL